MSTRQIHSKIRPMKREAGFTLIELMIVVAIIGILASMAIPTFIAMKWRTQRSELPTMLSAIQTSQNSYMVQYDTYLNCQQEPPAASMGAARRLFDATVPGWDELAFKPDGDVYGSYLVTANTNITYTILGETDLDEDGINAVFMAMPSLRPTRQTPSGYY